MKISCSILLPPMLLFRQDWMQVVVYWFTGVLSPISSPPSPSPLLFPGRSEVQSSPATTHSPKVGSMWSLGLCTTGYWPSAGDVFYCVKY